MRKFGLLAMIILSSIPAFAQEAGFLEAPARRGDFWVCLGGETAFYSYSGISVGPSLSAAYGSKFSIGLRAAWFFDTKNELDALELNFLLRYYFMGGAPSVASGETRPSAGPYLQLTGGPVLFFDKAEGMTMPAHWGRVSAGLTFGWRFLFGKLFFVEPHIRAGYPYLAGVGVSGGMHF